MKDAWLCFHRFRRVSPWKPKWAATLMCKMPRSNVPASWRQSPTDRRGVLVQVTDSAKRGKTCFSVVSEWGETLCKQNSLVTVLRGVAVENLKSHRMCSDRSLFLKLTWNWFEIICIRVEKISRKFHAGIVAGLKYIAVLKSHSLFRSRVYRGVH